MKYLTTKLIEPYWTGRCNPNSGHVCYSDYKFQGASEQIMNINENIMSCFPSIFTYVIMKITKINKLKHKKICIGTPYFDVINLMFNFGTMHITILTPLCVNNYNVQCNVPKTIISIIIVRKYSALYF